MSFLTIRLCLLENKRFRPAISFVTSMHSKWPLNILLLMLPILHYLVVMPLLNPPKCRFRIYSSLVKQVIILLPCLCFSIVSSVGLSITHVCSVLPETPFIITIRRKDTMLKVCKSEKFYIYHT